MLIDKGAPLMERDNNGDAPMHSAAKRGDMSIMCTMYHAGACPKQPGKMHTKMGTYPSSIHHPENI